jgi:protein-S-isoprenylcysteine O-methyltransferase Ste14
MDEALAADGPNEWLTRDRIARILVVAWFLVLEAVLALHFVLMCRATATDTALGLTQLLANGCMLLFVAMMAWLTIIREQPRLQASGPRPRITALIGTNLILFGVLFLPARGPLSGAEAVASSVLILIGNFLSVVVIRRLGGSFSIMAEARTLVIDGPYARVRHPLYLVEEIAVAGVFIQFASWPAVVLFALHFAFQMQRMRNEEAVLMQAFPRDYRAYAARTARLIPGIW